ncbi:MAG: alpha/beta hydrolase, partial [Methyloceanibacter sp.]
ASRLALQRHVEGLVLEAPFTSTLDVGRLLWPLFPLSLIMADQYRTIDRIGEVKAPLFIIHGGRDAIIPLDQARHVFHAANEPKSMMVVAQAGHNDLFERGAWDKVRGFLETLRPVPVVARAGRQVEIAAAASGEAR